MALETATISRREVAHDTTTVALSEWLNEAQTQSNRSNKWASAERFSTERAIEPNSFTPGFRLFDYAVTRENRAHVQDYSADIRTEWDKIDTRKRGIIDKDDLDRYLADPANVTHRDMAKFFRDNFDLVSNIAYDPMTPGNDLFKGYGIYKEDINKLESLTDPAKFKRLVKDEAFSVAAAALVGVATGAVSSVLFMGATLAAKSVGAIVAIGTIGAAATLGSMFAVGTAAGVGVGYLVYQSKVREHYSAKRAELESRMR